MKDCDILARFMQFLSQFESSIAEVASSFGLLSAKNSVSQQVSILSSLNDWKKDSSTTAQDCVFCEDVNVVRLLIVATFRGILHGERLLNSKCERREQWMVFLSLLIVVLMTPLTFVAI